MKAVTPLFLICLFLSIATPAIAVDERGPRFHNYAYSIADFYGVPQHDVLLLHNRGLPWEEIPVLFFISDRTGIAPYRIVDYRRRGFSWYSTARYFGLSPDVLYALVPVRHLGPPYGRAYGYYRNRHRGHTLSDRDMIRYVNRRFDSDYQRKYSHRHGGTFPAFSTKPERYPSDYSRGHLSGEVLQRHGVIRGPNFRPRKSVKDAHRVRSIERNRSSRSSLHDDSPRRGSLGKTRSYSVKR